MSNIRALNVADEGGIRNMYEEYSFRKKQCPDGKNPRFKGISEVVRTHIEETLVELEKTILIKMKTYKISI